MRKRKLKFTQGGLAFIFLAPSIIGLAIFFIIPFIGGFYYTLVDSPINGHFIGLGNFKDLLNNPSFIKAALNTGIFTLISVPLNIGLSLGLAILLNKKIYGRSTFRTIFIIPLVVPVASVVLIWQSFFDLNGALNSLLSYFRVNPIDWMKTDWARLVVVIVYLWKNLGYNMILFLAGLHNIPVEYYESAKIDGAGIWNEFIHITIIYLTPTSFFVYIIVMLMPFQVTLVSNYLVADKLGLLNSYLSIILPGIFSPFGVFLLKQYMEQIPDVYIEAAKIDGASEFYIFSRIIIPLCKGGIAAVIILVFIDNWNMVEQPLILLKDAAKLPLSIYLSRINEGEIGVSFAAATLYMLPMLLIFLMGEDYLVEGIQISGIKG
jgi:multiple sugar transport system permease protein